MHTYKCIYFNSLQSKILTTHIDEADSGYVDSLNVVKLISFKTFSTGSAKNKVGYLFAKRWFLFIFSVS